MWAGLDAGANEQKLVVRSLIRSSAALHTLNVCPPLRRSSFRLVAMRS
jgi:hypothetical protein